VHFSDDSLSYIDFTNETVLGSPAPADGSSQVQVSYNLIDRRTGKPVANIPVIWSTTAHIVDVSGHSNEQGYISATIRSTVSGETAVFTMLRDAHSVATATNVFFDDPPPWVTTEAGKMGLRMDTFSVRAVVSEPHDRCQL